MCNIVLIGFMGSGKTTVGRALSKELGFRFIDIDSEIESACGCAIPHIFKKYGEHYFRGVESRIAEKMAGLQNAVIATGGGLVKNKANMGVLAENGLIVYLKATPEQIYRNTLHDNNRPLLETVDQSDRKERIAELLCQREALYERYSRLTLSVTGKTVEEIVKEIVKEMNIPH